LIKKDAVEPEQLEEYLYHQIPVTKSLGVKVDICNNDSIQLSAPINLNYNHKKTAFGGSLSVMGILSGWSLVYMKLMGQRNEIVIQDSSMSYLKPVKGDFTSVSKYCESESWEKFHKSFERRGKGRVSVESILYCEGEIVAKHNGTYVALKTD
jgi:thioesterase domain-containing protein